MAAAQPERPTPTVVYGCKSSPDEKESVADQHRLVLQAIEKEGGRRLIARPFGEASASGYRNDRGPQLEAAIQAAVEVADEQGHAELWVFHSSRLARGSGMKNEARSLLEVFTYLRRRGVTLRSVTDDLYVTDEAAIGMAAKMANKFSDDLSVHVKRGLNLRKAGGKPVGPLPLGYTVVRSVVGGEVMTTRDVDPAEAAVVESIFARIESGMSFGAAARRLNADGHRTKRGGTWVSRTVREVIHNAAYKGEKGYPAIIQPERFDRIQASFRRLDPVAVARRSGGRKPTDDSYFLRGIARCLRCGAALYTRRQAGGRMYVCAHRRQGTGLCDAPPIPAELIEGHVLRHLSSFVGSVEGWLAEQVESRTAEHQARVAAVERECARLPALERKRDKLMARYVRMDDEGDRLARLALEAVESCDSEIAEVAAAVAQAEAVVGEWTGPPDVDAALDFYNGLVDFVTGHVQHARGAVELHRALSQVLTGLWAEVEPERDRLLVEFELNGHDWRHDTLASGTQIAPELAHRPTLPPASMSYEPFEPLRAAIPDASPWCTTTR